MGSRVETYLAISPRVSFFMVTWLRSEPTTAHRVFRSTMTMAVMTSWVAPDSDESCRRASAVERGFPYILPLRATTVSALIARPRLSRFDTAWDFLQARARAVASGGSPGEFSRHPVETTRNGMPRADSSSARRGDWDARITRAGRFTVRRPKVRRIWSASLFRVGVGAGGVSSREYLWLLLPRAIPARRTGP